MFIVLSLLILVFLPINGFFGSNVALIFFCLLGFFIALVLTVTIFFCYCLEYVELDLAGKDPQVCETSIFADLQKIEVTLLGIQTIFPFRLDYETYRLEALYIEKFVSELFEKIEKISESKRFVGYANFKNSGKAVQIIVNNPKFMVSLAVGGGVGTSAWLLNEHFKRQNESNENALKRQHESNENALKRQHERDRWNHESNENALNRQHEKDRWNQGSRRGWPFGGGNSSKFVETESGFLDFLSEISHSGFVSQLFFNMIKIFINCIKRFF